MLSLLKCEAWKLKRQKGIAILTLLGLLFPLLLSLLEKSGFSADGGRAAFEKEFDYIFRCNLVYSFTIFLPCLVGILAAILFFMERDCDTYKNLRAVPLSARQLIFAKIGILYLWAVVYSILTTLATVAFTALLGCGLPYNLLFKFGISVLCGILATTASLPAVVFVIYFNQTYLVSVLLSFGYAISNWLALVIFRGNNAILDWLPINGTLNWVGLVVINREAAHFGTAAQPLTPQNTLHLVVLLGLTFAFSLVLIIRFYKKWAG
ncbi:MAG: ABC transporter permease [Gemmiger sp.]|nr:ABC transporter permease [Gemmiger sp.]